MSRSSLSLTARYSLAAFSFILTVRSVVHHRWRERIEAGGPAPDANPFEPDGLRYR